jgi:hypothetical protein
MHDDDIKFPQDAKDPINESRRTYSDGFIPDQKGTAQHKPSGENQFLQSGFGGGLTNGE